VRFARQQAGPLGSFPFELYSGKGFARRDEVDFTEVR